MENRSVEELAQDYPTALAPSVHLLRGISSYLRDPAARRLAVEFGFLAGSTLFYQAVNLAANLYVARLLGPQQFGLWAALYIATTYGPTLTFGVLNSMGLEVPLRRGRGQSSENGDVVSATAISVLFVLLLVTIVGIAYGWTVDDGTRTAVWLTVPYFAAFMCQTFIQVYLKAHKSFSFISWQQTALGLFILLIAIPFLKLWRLPGFIIGQTLAIVLSMTIGGSRVKMSRLSFRHVQMLLPLAKIGIPIVTVGTIHLLLYTCDRWVVFSMLGTKQLGLYAFSVRIAGVWLLISGVLADQTYPRLAEAYGREGSIGALRRYVDRQLATTALLLIPGAVVAGFAAPSIIEGWFPQYSYSLRPLQVSLIGYVFLGLTAPFGSLLNVIQRQRVYLKVQSLVFVLQMALSIAVVKLGYGITGVAVGCSLAYLGYLVLMTTISYRILSATGEVSIDVKAKT